MAKKKTDQHDPTTAGAAVTSAQLRYVGPAGQTSPVFGALEPGKLYTTADATFAAYLAEKHPDYWQLEPAKE
ncbi:MAG: hypothetical protein Q8O42_09545 [Acidobacteriota bacterium]|nr:hypothetical protein [Acidobacteriota bacterium]